MLSDAKTTDRVIENIRRERERQDGKWGEQNHDAGKWMLILQEELGEACKSNLEGNRGEFVKELVEAAAVIAAWIESEVRCYEYDTGIRHRPSGGLAFDYDDKLPDGILPYPSPDVIENDYDDDDRPLMDTPGWARQD
jgi:hypothetical protein